ncbi:hypothetical protein A9404_04090 [Halothiobacillus diazotrophicus]|uniref:Uncharacterized protein n=1 Tax=Halothiobacillus diazotrophicus TaxID=1860122 RepID=A0A191ZFM3_9GAMM|nr:CRISPR-associated endonuclease Cas2 [Halothiobacillus diazotrophicus]ANJ66668.1 hypothetical protein A9404_04090 [Halothiobacillus diazotrophicus]
MSDSTTRRWYLLCYDISNARRLNRVHRVVSRQALAVQRSVYLFWGDDLSLSVLLASLRSRLAWEDDLRCYPVPDPIEIRSSRELPVAAGSGQDELASMLLDDRGGDLLGGLPQWTGFTLAGSISDVACR